MVKKNKSYSPPDIAFAYGVAYTIMALVFDNPVVREKFFTPFAFLLCGVWLFKYICEKKQIDTQKADNILGILYIRLPAKPILC